MHRKPHHANEAAVTDPKPVSVYSRRTLLLCAALLMLLVLSLSAVPMGVEYGVTAWLQQHGVKHASVKNIDVNLFNGTVLIEDLQGGDGLNIQRLSLRIDWLPLWKHIVHVRSLNLHGFNLHVLEKNGLWQISGIDHTLPEPGAKASAAPKATSRPWLVVVDQLVLESAVLQLKSRQFELTLPITSMQCSLSGLSGKQQQLVNRFQFGKTRFSGFGYQVQTDALKFSGQFSLSLLDDDLLPSIKSHQMALELDGLVLGNEQGAELAAVDALTLDGVQLDGADRIKVHAAKMDGVRVIPEPGKHRQVMLKHLEMTDLDADIQGKIAVAALDLNQLTATGFGGDSDIVQIASAKLSDIAVQANKRVAMASLVLHQVNVKRQQSKQLLGTAGTVKLNQFAMTGADAGSFASLILEQVKLPSGVTGSLGTVRAIRAIGARLENGGIYQLKTLQLNGLHGNILKRKHGGIAGLDMLAGQAGNSSKTTQKAQAHANTPKTAVRIDTLIVSPGSSINVRDESVFPYLKITVRFKRFKMAPVDSSGERSGDLDMLLQLNKSASLAAKGTLTPVPGNHFATDLKLVLKNVGLPRLSGYLEADVGQAIKTGQLNLDSDIRIANNRIDAKNHIIIRKLALDGASASGKAEQQPATPVGMPVGMALDMLRDHRGDITLDVPVSGALDDPDISLKSMINKALMSSLGTGAMTYAALVLQPYGSIIIAANLASGLVADAMKPKLTPILYAERSNALSADMNHYLSNITTLLTHKDFRLQICGIATRIEGEPIMQPVTDKQPGAGESSATPALSDAQLLELAQSRSDAVRKTLLDQGIAANRLFDCRAGIDESTMQARPRVELLLD